MRAMKFGGVGAWLGINSTLQTAIVAHSPQAKLSAKAASVGASTGVADRVVGEFHCIINLVSHKRNTAM